MTIRFAILGLGNIGMQHTETLLQGHVPGAVLSALCGPRKPQSVAADVPYFATLPELLAADVADAVLIATPTMDHVPSGLQVLEHGLHLLMEKPLGMSAAEVHQLLAAAPADRCFAVMLNQRFHPHYAAIKTVLEDGLLGRLQRYNWTMTTWYRPQVYYDVSRWRGTWRGEGGGLLINQCIHNLDVLFWWLGAPAQIYAVAGFGRHHAIEVEDAVTATLQYADGVVGTLTASCGEAPGVNRLELVGDAGTMVFDDAGISLTTCEPTVSEHCATTDEMFGMPQMNTVQLDVDTDVKQHAEVMGNFVTAIAGQAELLTPASEGLGSIQLANTMLASAWQGQPLSFPVADADYAASLAARIDASQLRKPVVRSVQIDMQKSFR